MKTEPSRQIPHKLATMLQRVSLLSLLYPNHVTTVGQKILALNSMD